ncbi:PAS domain S-box protein [Halapricum sp. CBA1109]|uniref:ATP-binding response regulator n=1 Tax=Halapricum sp. CBA1109 TaxID=2668068 RepID=UPI0012FA1A1F|nr:PAS domain S-box protein [Halapricum sp. CBA1109]MUV88754.1 PAS domain S-box protein [Halapricum sp. CBA1109]
MTDTGRGIRVLHVDDDPSFLEVVATYLENEDEDLTVFTEDTAADGVDRIEADDIDCVVSDYRMPEMDGLAFLEAVREAHPEIPFVLYTGHGSEEIASEAISAGVTDYMQKETGTDQYTLLANTIRNAVEHQRTETALEESEQRYRTLVEQSHDGIYIMSDRSFVFLNDRVCEITGYDRESLLGVDAFELLHPDDRDRVGEIAARRRAGEDAPQRYQARITREDGEVRHLEFSVRQITYEGEYAVLGSVRDVTERHRQEQRLEEYASIVAHDLRNPLNVIAGRIDLARETGEDMHFDAIERSVDSMETLLEDMRDLASAGVPVHEAGIVETAAVVEAVWSDLDTDGATLTVGDDLPAVEADADRIERLVAELLSNPVVHGGEGTAVRVTVEGDAIVVADDGDPIPEGERDRVFEAGYTTDTDRTGFGLAIAQWIADAHGWDLSVAESDGGGTRVRLSGLATV